MLAAEEAFVHSNPPPGMDWDEWEKWDQKSKEKLLDELALAELEQCREAREWMLRAISAAEQSADTAELGRLKAQLPKYETADCRSAVPDVPTSRTVR